MSTADEMREALAVVCRQARDEGGYSRTEVAAKIKRGEQSVSRFEQGIGKWNPQTGAMVAAYAELTGVPLAYFTDESYDPFGEQVSADDLADRLDRIENKIDAITTSPAQSTAEPDARTSPDTLARRDMLDTHPRPERSEGFESTLQPQEDPHESQG